MSKLREALYRAADIIADAIETNGAADWVDQNESPIGRRRHLDAVRTGKLKGHKEGHRVLVRRSDLDAFIAKHSVPKADNDADEARAIAKTLRLVRGMK